VILIDQGALIWSRDGAAMTMGLRRATVHLGFVSREPESRALYRSGEGIGTVWMRSSPGIDDPISVQISCVVYQRRAMVGDLEMGMRLTPFFPRQ
jgi:hypothetical protein